MKLFFFLALLGHALSSTAPREIKWAEVELQVQQIRDGLLTSGVTQIIDLATSDNSEVGALISAILNEAQVDASQILDVLNNPIQTRNLTLDDANPVFEEYLIYAQEVALKLAEGELLQLSGMAFYDIESVFLIQGWHDLYSAEQIRHLLQEIDIKPTNWTDVDFSVEYIFHMMINNAICIKTEAMTDNPEVGGKIGAEINDAVDFSIIIVEIAREAVRNQTLGLKASLTFIRELRRIWFWLRENNESDLARLSEAVYRDLVHTFEMLDIIYIVNGIDVFNEIAGVELFPDEILKFLKLKLI